MNKFRKALVAVVAVIGGVSVASPAFAVGEAADIVEAGTAELQAQLLLVAAAVVVVAALFLAIGRGWGMARKWIRP